MARPRRRSAGIVLHRDGDGGPEVLLVHPGGPFWAKKDLGAWSIPKGEYEPDEDPRACALREFEEETGTRLDAAELVELGTVVQKAGKEVSAWAVRGDLDPATVRSNTSRWSGRRARAASRSSRRSTARSGSRSTRRGRSSCRLRPS